jgi:hypothetical protein
MRALAGLFVAAIVSALAISLSWGSEPRSQFSISDRKEADKERKLILDAVAFVSKELTPTANRSPRDGGRKLVRVTARPVHIPGRSAVPCAPVWEALSPVGPHADRWIDVYVTRSGSAAMTNGRGTYPKSTMILKRKYRDQDGKTTELFTGMLKREKGYNPEAGDWQFFVLDSRGEEVTEFGRLVSCMNCHAAFKNSDFVSRKYVAALTAR